MANGAVDIGVWDQVCAFGQYQHQSVDGTPCITSHDASTCKAMLDDFARHPECDIFYDKQHEVIEALGEDALDREKMNAWAIGDGHALAWANAMVMILGGQVARYEAHAAAPESPPTAEEVLRQTDGTLREDGVYCLRSEVTPRGADPSNGLAAFRKTSPYFVFEKDGNRLLCLTATNDPRMRGCALAYSRGQKIAMSRISMASNSENLARLRSLPEWEDYGAGAFLSKDRNWKVTVGGSDPSFIRIWKKSNGQWEQFESVSSVDQIARYVTMENRNMNEMMARAGCMESDTPDQKLEKMSAHLRKMEDEGKKKDEESAMARKKMEDEMSSMKRAMDDKGGKDPPEEEKKEREAMSRRLSALEEKNSMLTAELQKATAAGESVKKFEVERTRERADTFSKGAVAMRRIKPDHKGTEEQTIAWLRDKHIKDPAEAEDLLCAEGTFGPSEAAVMSRLGSTDARGSDGQSPDEKFDRLIRGEIAEARKAGQTMEFAQAMGRVKSKHPDLHREWSAKSGRLAS